MRRITIAPNTRFGRMTTTGLVVIRHGSAYWECRCDCGATVVVSGAHLRRGQQSCTKCSPRQHRLTHGGARRGRRDSAYVIWHLMRDRCGNPQSTSYQWYGAKGVSVCAQWSDFSVFRRDMGPRPSPAHSLDRIDPRGNYEPGNCRWATDEEQASNKRDSRRVLVNGRTVSIKEACAITGIRYSAAIQRIQAGWPDERTFSEPVREVAHA